MPKTTLAAAGLACLFWTILATPSAAQRKDDLTRPTEAGTYFNRPGATVEEHDDAVLMCAAHARGMPQASGSPFVPAGLVEGAFSAAIAGAEDRARFQANMENCMVATGWRVVAVSRQESGQMNRLNREAVAERIAPWIGMETPHGWIVRTFENEGARGDTVWGALPGGRQQRQFSVRSVDLGRTPRGGWAPVPSAISGVRLTSDSLTPEQLAALPPDAAVLVVKVVGTGRTNGEGFQINRHRSWPGDTSMSGVSGFYAGVRWTMFKGSSRERREALIAVAVRPGDYRIESRMNTLDFCLGSPSVRIGPGETVFMGTFDIAGEVLGPDMALAPAQEMLVVNPERLAAVRPAEWRNGSVSRCNLTYLYALEIPGAPPLEPSQAVEPPVETEFQSRMAVRSEDDVEDVSSTTGDDVPAEPNTP
ncbi:hypothetical protein [Brevundimonas sp.]|jgi:hypothetical protein|uniref:hypothetical protein n=1 Tax=Brevundimonas sp. TaxID=1871086 RepID=UPI002E15B31A|nr:hypothetical protein [Brevundimonas sp.]